MDRISDEELDEIVTQFHNESPDSGLRYLEGRIRDAEIRVQRERIRKAAKRVHGPGLPRQKAKIARREFWVAALNALWSGDGHHKLIMYGIVIHGFIEAYSRLITALKASTNNRADTVLGLFISAVEQYGLPSRVRGDRGGENIDVAVYMTMRRGLDRGSFLWGPSTRNTRIERLWREVGSQFVRRWKVFFLRLEAEYDLDKNNTSHLWLLHTLFLESLNEDCDRFRQNWNAHGVSGKATQHRSPHDIFFLDAFIVGKCDERDAREFPPTINLEILRNQKRQAHKKPKACIESTHPFGGAEAWTAIFWKRFKTLLDERRIPQGYGFYDTEGKPWDEVAAIKVNQQVINITLPKVVWWVRAVHWVLALQTMYQVWESMDAEAERIG
ncbi:hypothetical protein FRB90_001208 [Tulasnella sp. 427]|nr:hypothetical protein FRB90_001208 [Tulasnella sp. 427]